MSPYCWYTFSKPLLMDFNFKLEITIFTLFLLNGDIILPLLGRYKKQLTKLGDCSVNL